MDLDTLNFNDLPSMLMSERYRFPGIECVYIVLDEDGKPLYIGETYHLRGRWAGHKCIKLLRHRPDIKVAWVTFPNRNMRGCAEMYLIDIHLPVYNLSRSGSGEYNRRYWRELVRREERKKRPTRHAIRDYVHQHTGPGESAEVAEFCVGLLKFIDGVM